MDGLDTEYFKKNLLRIVRDADSYTPQEMKTALTQLAKVADRQCAQRKVNLHALACPR